jgi:ribonuclease Y
MNAAGDAASAALLVGGLGAVLGGIAGAIAGQVAGRRARRRRAGRALQQAQLSVEAACRRAELAAREEALARRTAAGEQLRQAEASLVHQAGEIAAREQRLRSTDGGLAAARARLDGRATLAEREAEAARRRQAAAAALAEVRARLERVTGTSARALRAALVQAEIEHAGVRGAQLIRQEELEAGAGAARAALGVVATAAGRLAGHYLTERSQSLLVIGPAREGHPAVSAGELNAIAAATGVKLTLAEAGDVVRLEGLDGVAREVARRSLVRLLSGAAPRGASGAAGVAAEIAAALEREVLELGGRAFETLQLAPAHPEIVQLVGRLGWRTSYTQNQWHHAVEAAQLCGMMAEELNLDRALARRAGLLHDIGKALSALEGPHAVIGAQQARRLGEPEVVANAIGAHHADEPAGSPYAHLVAAADAMSGARPGARRHMEEAYLARIADLERISRAFPGVAEAVVAQGGREVRVLVREQEVDDLGAVQLSSEIARAITCQLSFPGQIRVTVIRELKAIARTAD